MPAKTVPILCAECESTIVVTPDMLDGAYACEKCGADIDFTLYEPLEAMIEGRRAAARIAKEKQDAEKKRAREVRLQAERAEAERQRQRLATQKEAEKETARKQAKQQMEEESRFKMEVEKQRRAKLAIGTVAADIFCVITCILGAGLGLLGIAVILFGKSAIHEIEGGVAMLLGSVFFFAGIIVSVVTNHAHGLALKLDAVRDAIQDAAKSDRR
ncbi:hypothetical protein B7486_16535 [cyanobacterium TDX16]|nr:hypothetical protein B7486_16535 [cyanobacterium TDX16]